MGTLVEVKELRKVYRTGEVACEALRGVSLEIAAGDFVAIMGPSGSGKSTLLHLIGGLDRPTGGSVNVGGHMLSAMDETKLARFRRLHIGFVFQFFNLVDNLTVQANVELPALLASGDRRAARRRAEELLARLGIADQARKHPWELSGGQQQRVAIARALMNRPLLLLADEPTGNLDRTAGQEVMQILSECHRDGQTILVVTHDPLVAAYAGYVLFLQDGQIVGRTAGGDPSAIAAKLAELG